MKTPIERARAYIAKLPLAASGQRGHDATFRVACCLVHGFALPAEQAFKLINEYNERLSEPWTNAELWHKISDADKIQHRHPRGHLLEKNPGFRRPPATPQLSPIRWPVIRRDPPPPRPGMSPTAADAADDRDKFSPDNQSNHRPCPPGEGLGHSQRKSSP